MKRYIWIFTLLFISAILLPAQTNLEDVKTFKLKNGMKFIVMEDHTIPNIALHIFFKVGSRNEYPGITGLSHFFEHMMFNGAKKYGPKMFDRVMEAAGGANNAFTSEDITCYTDWFPSDKLEVMFELESDRIGNLALDDKMVESERGVVISERITGLENSNFVLLSEQVNAVAFVAHPYRWSVIGYESDIKNWKKSDLQRYFDTYYAPNNAVAVLVGDLTFDGAKSLAQEYFESIPPREPPRPVHTIEPPQMGEKRLMVEKDVTSPNILVAYHVPNCKSDDYYPLTLLNTILSDGNSSRLYRSLVDEKQLAVQIFSFYPTALDPTLYYIYAICAGDVEAETLETAIHKEFDEIVENGISEIELQKAKNKQLVDFYRGMATIRGKADSIGSFEVFFGSYKKMFDAPEEVKKVTRKDIQTVAKKYFKKSNRTVGILQKREE